MSVQSFVHFSLTSCSDDGKVQYLLSLLQHIPNILTGVKAWTSLYACENYFLLSLNHCVENLSPINPVIVILEYACALREENNLLVEKLGHSVYSGQLT